MTGNVINLRQVRKQRERAARRQQADENRDKHGRTRAEREQVARDAETRARRLDGHWLDQTDIDASADPSADPIGVQDASIDPAKDRDEP